MNYCLQLIPHPNTRYRNSGIEMSIKELNCILASLDFNTPITHRMIGMADFLFFSCPEMTDQQAAQVLRHSSALMLAAVHDDWIRPLTVIRQDYLPRELSEILKYKGKTSTQFTRMMINTALAAAQTSVTRHIPHLIDPMCGKGTTLFCAVEMGMNASGIDVDRTDLLDAVNHFSHYTKQMQMKHGFEQTSMTTPLGAIPTAQYTFADTKQHFKTGNVRKLTFYQGDTAAIGFLLKKTPADILVTDLPYGIQHAPIAGKKAESFQILLKRVLPQWKKALRVNGALCFSFNTMTLKTATVEFLLKEAGFDVLTESPYGSCPHFVEQAVVRDFVTAINRKTHP